MNDFCEEKRAEPIVTAPPEPPVPEQPMPQPFAASRREVIAALVSYVAAWIYISFFLSLDYANLYLVIFAAIFSVGGLLFYRDRLGTWEHWVWLGCMWLCLGCMVLGRNQVWGRLSWMFLHCYAIYWVLCLSGRLLRGGSSAFLPLDALNGAVIFPDKHLFCFLRTRVLWWGWGQWRAGKKHVPRAGCYALLALCAAAVLFCGAGYLLIRADDNFASLLDRFVIPIDSDRLEEYFLRLLLSLPVGAYLFGLVAGTGRETPARLERQREGVGRFLTALGKVSAGVWTVLVGAFVLLYLLFFSIQGSYLFGAFARNLPEGFTVAQYARQGFFELCQIMALNFALLWLVLYSSRSPVAKHLPAKLMCTALLAESILFAITALSKLILYINCFGFTPLRLQSFWLVCVLAVGCVCALVSLWAGKRTAKVWILYTGVSLALLHVY